MARKPIISVILTPEAREILEDNSIRLLIKDGIYFNCESVNQNGYFLDMTISLSEISEHKGENLNAILSIPTHFVLYMISGKSRKILGFSDD